MDPTCFLTPQQKSILRRAGTLLALRRCFATLALEAFTDDQRLSQ